MRLIRKLITFRFGEKGATTAEYALILALVVIVLISTLSQLGNVLKARLMDIINQISNAS